MDSGALGKSMAGDDQYEHAARSERGVLNCTLGILADSMAKANTLIKSSINDVVFDCEIDGEAIVLRPRKQEPNGA